MHWLTLSSTESTKTSFVLLNKLVTRPWLIVYSSIKWRCSFLPYWLDVLNEAVLCTIGLASWSSLAPFHSHGFHKEGDFVRLSHLTCFHLASVIISPASRHTTVNSSKFTDGGADKERGSNLAWIHNYSTKLLGY